MDVQIEGLKEWQIDLKEVSASWYVLRAVRTTGNVFEKSGINPEMMIDPLSKFELTVQEAIQAKKLEAKS